MSHPLLGIWSAHPSWESSTCTKPQKQTQTSPEQCPGRDQDGQSPAVPHGYDVLKLLQHVGTSLAPNLSGLLW